MCQIQHMKQPRDTQPQLRRHYCLGIRICYYLKIPKGEGASRILGHWACYKVSMISGYRLAVTYMLAGVFLESAYGW